MSASLYDRFFYHAFPRPRPGVSADELGLNIVSLVARHGLLLTPEVLLIDEYSGLAAAQTRLCLTELHESELAHHSTTFGNFAFEMRKDEARRLGAMPVIYLPDPVVHGRTRYFDDIGYAIAEKLADIQAVLSLLGEIEEGAADQTRLGRWRMQRLPTLPAVEMAAQDLRNLLANLKNRNDFRELVATLKGLSSLYYKTDSDYSLDPRLAYYRQREWRIISDLVSAVGRNSQMLNESQAKEVRDSNPEFFDKEIDWTNGKSRRIDLCQILVFPKDAWPALVRRLLVPNHLVSRVLSMPEVLDLGIPVVGSPSDVVHR